MKNKEIEELLICMNKANFHEQGIVIETEKCKLLLSYIEQLEKKVDQYENPDDLTLFYMWLDTKAKDKMKQLEADYKEANDSITWWTNRFNAVERDKKQLEKENDRLKKDYSIIVNENCDYLLLEKKVEQLENNRDKAIEYVESHFIFNDKTGECYQTYTFDKDNVKKLYDILKGDSE